MNTTAEVITDTALLNPAIVKRGTVLDFEQQARDFSETVGVITVENPRMTTRNVDVFYADKHAIIDVSLDIGKNEVISMIGPSGCGKSTYIRCLNRMNDTIDLKITSPADLVKQTKLFRSAKWAR